jgi:hypothetical protein
MTERLNRLAPVTRTVAWAPLTASAVACAALLGAPVLSQAERWPWLAALALCTGAAFLLDDDAGTTVAATPRSLARRRMLRVGLALPLLAGVWTASVWYATAADGARFGPEARAALSLQFAAMLALTLAASAAAQSVMPDERGGWIGAVALWSLLALALLLPEPWTLLAAPGDAAWHEAQQCWAALLAFGLLALAWASRDPAARALRRGAPARHHTMLHGGQST